MADLDQSSFTSGMANTATGVSVATGAFAFLNENAAAISVLIGFASLLVALIFYILNYRLRVKAQNLYRDEILQEVVDQIIAQVDEDEVDTTIILRATANLKDKRHPKR